MKLTKNLNLPVYDDPINDTFDLTLWNEANESIDKSHEEVMESKKLVEDIFEEIPKVNASAEVIDARGGEATLGNKVRKINSLLEEITNTKLDKNGIVTMANMGQDVKTAMTGGSVAVVGVNAILEENIVDNQITKSKLDLYSLAENKNNASTNIAGKYINHSNGTLVDGNGVMATDFIDLSLNKSGKISMYLTNTTTNLPVNAFWRGAFYDSSKKYISGMDNNGVNNIIANSIKEVPPNAKYVRVSFLVGTYNNIMVVFGDNLIPFKPYLKTLFDFENIKGNFINDKSISLKKLDCFTTYRSKNWLDYNKITNNKRVDHITGIIENNVDANWSVTDYIEISSGQNVFFANLNTVKDSFLYNSNGRYAIYDENKTFISGNTISGGITIPTIPSNAKYVVFSVYMSKELCVDRKAIVSNITNYPTLNSIMLGYELFKYQEGIPAENIVGLNIVDSGTNASDWKDKTWLSYGDSITAIGNINGQGSWQDYVSNYFSFKTHYGRGIGGQTFRWNEKVWFANSDGTLNSRNDNLNYNDCQSSDIPSGCTKHRGAFCSWDRIKTMIPDNIKNDIDMIFLFGANNDGYFAYEDINNLWVSNATTDIDWVNASENVHKGDYKLDSLSGAIASTIMKLQARCPNAIIVAGTCWSGRGNADASNYPTKDGTNIGLMRVSNETLKQCYSYFSIPVVDIYNTSGVNQLNRNKYVTDTIHPYNDGGKKMLARTVIGGLKGILPNII